MRKLTLKMSISVDGFVASKEQGLDWIFASADEGSTAWNLKTVWNASLHIMGAKTYRDMISWWPYSEGIYAAPMNAIPKAAFTRKGAGDILQGGVTHAASDAAKSRDAEGGKAKTADPAVLKMWRNAYIGEGPLDQEIAALKQGEGKPILAHGGASFARSLIATGLVDEFQLLTHPAVLGQGLPIFSELPHPRMLNLVETASFPGGVVAKVYQPR